MFYHKPVLLKEIIENLVLDKSGIYLDATLGGGGHSSNILSSLDDRGKLIAIDQDEDALKFSSYLEKDSRVTFVHDNFINMDVVLYLMEIEKVNGILMDIGVSSWQIDSAERGFSYIRDAKLDMRMDRKNTLTAYEVINYYKEEELARIIYEYGEENFSKKIARHIVMERKKKITTTFHLVDIIRKAVKSLNFNCVKRVFQAIRIEVNSELLFLEIAIKKALSLLEKEGVLAVITFHSLEDRIVKNIFSEYTKYDYQLVNKKPITASREEIMENTRSKSAKLRIIKRK